MTPGGPQHLHDPTVENPPRSGDGLARGGPFAGRRDHGVLIGAERVQLHGGNLWLVTGVPARC
jgi:hypothetical protein